ncbi:MAG: hypothetical protein DRP02_02215 [Candidatus Gerdarchaeota archaeon]|nr:MAG: hypothetical protein DRP02_02215 [Candidatus Gerdarchaeota archaeon]
MEKIESLPFKQQAGCKLIYIAICSFSAKQKNTPEIECYKFDIARFASVSEKTVQRYLPELEKLKIIKIGKQGRTSSGKYEKMTIWLENNNLPVGHIEESCEKVVGKLLDTKSDIYKENKETKEIKKEEGEKSPTPSEVNKEFFSNKELQEKTISYFIGEYKISREECSAEISKFVNYWTEPTKSGKKVRWETEKTFDVKRRLITWFSKSWKSFGKKEEEINHKF